MVVLTSKFFWYFFRSVFATKKQDFGFWCDLPIILPFTLSKPLNLAKLSKFLVFFYFQGAIIGRKYRPIGRYASQPCLHLPRPPQNFFRSIVSLEKILDRKVEPPPKKRLFWGWFDTKMQVIATMI